MFDSVLERNDLRDGQEIIHVPKLILHDGKLAKWFAKVDIEHIKYLPRYIDEEDMNNFNMNKQQFKVYALVHFHLYRTKDRLIDLMPDDYYGGTGVMYSESKYAGVPMIISPRRRVTINIVPYGYWDTDPPKQNETPIFR